MLKIISRTVKLASSRFKIEAVQYSFDDGTKHLRDIIRHPGAVVILAIDSSGQLIFVRQPRVALGMELLELPAGTLEKDEEPLICAKRELAEEAGVAAREWQGLGEIYPAPGICDEIQYLFLARGLSEYELPKDLEERITVHKFSPKSVEEIVADGSLQDAKSLALLYRAKVAGFW